MKAPQEIMLEEMFILGRQGVGSDGIGSEVDISDVVVEGVVDCNANP